MILQALRDKTHDLHAQVEQAVAIPQRLHDVGTYRQLLKRFYCLYVPLEERLASALEETSLGTEFAKRRKIHLLEDDLQTLGCSRAEIRTWPLCDELPDIQSLPQALGCLYVVEGSTLGGQYIRKDVRERLGFTAERGCAFFSGYQAETGTMWKSFGEMLTAFASDHPDAQPEIIAAAIATFTCFEHWVAEGQVC